LLHWEQTKVLVREVRKEITGVATKEVLPKEKEKEARMVAKE